MEKNNSPVGQSLKRMTPEEMNHIYGGGDGSIKPMSTLLCSAGISFIASYLGSAALKCGKDNK